MSPFNKEVLPRLVKVIFVESESVSVTPDESVVAEFNKLDADCADE